MSKCYYNWIWGIIMYIIKKINMWSSYTEYKRAYLRPEACSALFPKPPASIPGCHAAPRFVSTWKADVPAGRLCVRVFDFNDKEDSFAFRSSFTTQVRKKKIQTSDNFIYLFRQVNRRYLLKVQQSQDRSAGVGFRWYVRKPLPFPSQKQSLV